jgi:deoxyhypusine synthase
MEKRDVVRQVHLRPGMTVAELIDLFGKTGAYNAGALYRATNILERMIRDRAAIRFFGLAGAMVPAGMGIVADLIEQGHIDVLVSTGANCVHDIIEAIGCVHYHGSSISSDIELRQQLSIVFMISTSQIKPSKDLKDSFRKS